MAAAAPIAIIPTLDSQSILTDPRDIMGYVLRWYVTAPKSISDSTPRQMISIIDTISRYENDKSTLIAKVTEELQGVFNNYFANGTASVDTTANDNGDGSYNLTITLAVVQANSTTTLGADISTDSTGMVSLKWHPSFT